jgi:anti-sigma regulatory factor (Ser/Thr protein kinase)
VRQSKPFDNRTHLAVPSDPRYVGVVREWAAGIGTIAGLDGAGSGEVSLAVVEAFSNVVRHSYRGDSTKKIDLRCAVRKDRLEIVIRDYGKTTHPTEIRARNLDELKPGGLGVHFIREIMDEVDYEPGPGLGMRLKMVRRLDRGPRKGSADE